MNKHSVHLFNIIPIELFKWKHRQNIVDMIVMSLHAAIHTHNALFRCSNSIMIVISMAIFLFVYSIIPFIAISVSVGMSMYTLDVSLPELYQLSLEKKSLFVSFGMGFLMFYVAEIAIVTWCSAQNCNYSIDSLQQYLIQKISTTYSTFIVWLRNFIISLYRQTGWDVLELIIKQQNETSYSLQKAAFKHNVPTDIIKLIDSFVLDAELVTLSNAKNENSLKNISKATIKPCDIFEMYASSTIH